MLEACQLSKLWDVVQEAHAAAMRQLQLVGQSEREYKKEASRLFSQPPMRSGEVMGHSLHSNSRPRAVSLAKYIQHNITRKAHCSAIRSYLTWVVYRHSGQSDMFPCSSFTMKTARCRHVEQDPHRCVLRYFARH